MRLSEKWKALTSEASIDDFFNMGITSDDIYTGLWTNWARGYVFGATITVPSSTGAILTAILAIFVQLAANHIWHLVAYIIHRIRDTDKVLEHYCDIKGSDFSNYKLGVFCFYSTAASHLEEYFVSASHHTSTPQACVGMALPAAHLSMALEHILHYRPCASLCLSWHSGWYILILRYLHFRH